MCLNWDFCPPKIREFNVDDGATLTHRRRRRTRRRRRRTTQERRRRSRGEEKIDLLLTPATGAEEEGPKQDRPIFPNTGRLERLEAFRVAQG